MSRDKTQSHIRIIEAAKNEFMKYGFVDASLRRIASEAGIQVGGLYKHFENKEEMFAALVDSAIEGFMDYFHSVENNYFDELDNVDIARIWDEQKETVKIMEYIYEHIDEFKLIICKSQGTRYETFTHDIAIKEEETTLRYMQELRKRNIPIKFVEEKEFHLLVTASVDAIFQAVVHDFTKEQAIHYANTLQRFYLPAWKALFGI
ncbi:MAG: TetR/AcrR family transcriptional regulator [Clostridiales bacterium]|nr:TetR/AcrR family transcriptional regulator [Clostridiales bacterium]